MGSQDTRKEEMNMTATLEDRKINKQTNDLTEMIHLLKQLSENEKHEVKGILIGLQLSKQSTS